MRTTTVPVIDDLDLAELEVDPYPAYARLRRDAPIAYLPAIDEWLVTRWDDCAAIAADDRSLRGGHATDDEFFGPNSVLRIEGAAHAGMRAGIDARLRPRVVKSYLDEATRPVVVAYLDAIRERGSGDLATDVFERISVRVIGNVLGLRELDDETLVRWFHTLSNGRANETADPAASELARTAIAEIDDRLRAQVERLRAHPDDSIISHMVHGGTTERGPRGYDDIAPSINVIILGGFQEPGNSVSNAFHGILGDPAQLRALQDDPDGLAAAAVQEGLRWLAPIGQVSRTVIEDITYDGARIPSGARLSLVVASANRDEDRFDVPDVFDLSRMLRPNATFGYGAHFCAGHFLARGVAQIALAETVRRLPGLRRDPAAETRVRGYLFRGVKHLPVLWDV